MGSAFQLIGPTRRHADGLCCNGNNAGIGQHLNKFALLLVRPAIIARAPTHRHPTIVGGVIGYFGWDEWKGVAKSMLAALALMSLLGVRYPMQMLPLMLYEMAWKTVFILFIVGRHWLTGTIPPDIEGVFWECIGIVIMYFVVPWRYIWARYFAQPMEAWRK
jgi:hypothetical protein